MTNEELRDAISRVEGLMEEIDSPDIERGERLKLEALRMVLDAAEIVLVVRADVLP